MHRKAVFFLAGAFLVVALVVPPIIFVLQADKDLDNYIISQNPTGHQTNGNITTLTPAEIRENHYNTFITVIVVEVVFVSLFAVTMYYGINQPHANAKQQTGQLLTIRKRNKPQQLLIRQPQI